MLRGMVRVTTREGAGDIRAGQVVLTRAGEWVRYSTQEAEGAE